MSDCVLRLYAAFGLAVVLIFGALPAYAQSGDAKPAEKPKTQTETPAKDSAKKAEELSDTAKATSGPAGNPECVWLGTRVVNLLYRNDMDTAFRHLDLYDRFGCPGGHIQAAFRCLVRQVNIDLKVPETVNARVHTCWINPATQPTPPAAAQNPSAAPTGTSTQ